MKERNLLLLTLLLTLLALGGCDRQPADEDWGHRMAESRHHRPMMDAMMNDDEFMHQWTARMADDPDAAYRMMGPMMHEPEVMTRMMDGMMSDPELRAGMIRHMRDHQQLWGDVMTELSRDPGWCEDLVERCGQGFPVE